MSHDECWFFTAHTHGRWPTFRDPFKVRVLMDALAYVSRRDPFESLALVVLPDHVHGVCRHLAAPRAFERRWDALEGLLIEALRLPASPWEAPPRTRLLSLPQDVTRAIDYAHFNPVRHGLVADPRAWVYSTLRSRLFAA
jgi:putative transposase